MKIDVFTGLVETIGEIVAVLPEPPGSRLVVAAPSMAGEAAVGESIAVNGCCLTVVGHDKERLEFQAGPETLARTNLEELCEGSFVNLERAVRLGDRLGGHFVTGHIDGVATIEERIDDREWSTFWFHVPMTLSRQMASKGSVAVDGVSLTLVDVNDERFSVQLIPHTLAITTLGRRQPGDRVNVETDLLAKYVERQLSGIVPGPKSRVPGQN